MPNDAAQVISSLLERIKGLERRIRSVETFDFARLYGLHATSYLVNNASISAGTSLYTDDARGANGVPANAKGIFITLMASANVAGYLSVDMDTPNVYSQRLSYPAAWTLNATMMVRLDSYGKFYIAATTANFSAVYVSVIGYWL